MDKSEKSKKRTRNPHLDEDMREFVVNLWMRGVHPDAIDRMARRRIYRERQERQKKFENCA